MTDIREMPEFRQLLIRLYIRYPLGYPQFVDYLDGLTTQESADKHKISARAAEHRLTRARAYADELAQAMAADLKAESKRG